MVTTTPKAVARTLFSSTLSPETGHMMCLNLSMVLLLSHYPDVASVFRTAVPPGREACTEHLKNRTEDGPAAARHPFYVFFNKVH
jgi:hypothetical protein